MSKVSRKNQITLPVSELREAGIDAGDDVVVRAIGPGRMEVERVEDVIARFRGCMPAGTWPAGALEALRDEWER
jgi:bifunctional DNA-binding transcriptional regulator/antitoxin component of YhaV-PrlF toxin-antitoxin module